MRRLGGSSEAILQTARGSLHSPFTFDPNSGSMILFSDQSRPPAAVRPQPNDSRPSSQQDILDDLPVYIGQSNVTSTEAVGQLLVVDPEQVQNGGVEIVYL
jgi:hypothetical protein